LFASEYQCYEETAKDEKERRRTSGKVLASQRAVTEPEAAREVCGE